GGGEGAPPAIPGAGSSKVGRARTVRRGARSAIRAFRGDAAVGLEAAAPACRWGVCRPRSALWGSQPLSSACRSSWLCRESAEFQAQTRTRRGVTLVGFLGFRASRRWTFGAARLTCPLPRMTRTGNHLALPPASGGPFFIQWRPLSWP